jgi:multidrug efflux pump subunit AcrB
MAAPWERVETEGAFRLALPDIPASNFPSLLGVFYGLTGKSHTYRELEDEAKIIKNELLKIKDVAKIEIYGIQTPTIDVSVSPSVMAQSGITTSDIARAFEAQNKVVDAGGIDAGQNRLRIESTGNFYSLDDIRNLTIVSRSGEHFRLADIAQIEESRIHHRSIYNANEMFKVGFAGYLDVLSADERFLDCELERIALNVESCKLHIMLYRALGGGSN